VIGNWTKDKPKAKERKKSEAKVQEMKKAGGITDILPDLSVHFKGTDPGFV
jgi:hypothetical protein